MIGWMILSGCSDQVPFLAVGFPRLDEIRESSIEIEDAQTLSYTRTLTIPGVAVAAGGDVCLDAGALDVDMLGQPLDHGPDVVWLTRWSVPMEAVATGLSEAELSWADVEGAYGRDAPGDRFCLADLQAVGGPFDPETFVAEPDGSWFVLWYNHDPDRTRLVGAVALDPSPASDGVDVVVDEGAVLTLDIDPSIGSVAAPVDHADLVLDWSGVTADALGGPLDPELADQLVIHQIVSSVLLLNPQTFDHLGAVATARYEVSTFGRTEVDLDEAHDASGAPFGGFTHDGAWVVTLSCSTCVLQTDLLVAVVEVR